MISSTAEYALRSIVHLAEQPETAKTAREIAEVTCVPHGYLSKVLRQLADAGLVRSQRGLGGGYTLAHVPSKISVLDVLNAVDPIQRIRSCPLELKSHRKKLCALHHTLDNALSLIEQAFSECTIETLLDDNRNEAPLCRVTREPTNRPVGGNLAYSNGGRGEESPADPPLGAAPPRGKRRKA